MNTASARPGDPIRIPYGSDPSQFGELHLPTGTRRPGTAVVIHGGFWRAAYGLDLGTPLAADLAARGWVAWNLEYRRVGDGGGWSATFDDIAAGIDALAGIASSGAHGALDLARVVAIGHSAGGHLATWAAARPALGSGSPMDFAAGSVALTGVVSQAGVLDLEKAVRGGVGGTAVQDLLGGEPGDVADRYRIADPTRQLPLGIPVHCVHGDQDGNVPLDQSVDYVAAATAAGDTAVLHEIQGDHFALIDVGSPAWTTVVELLPSLLG
ncbi:alpha/beta hydrolase [Nakamurella sp. A5-74]|uniref:Alpha/beta hydrolase n=1 Tax=Nakamurella sp. A5-74 TaxID=3158264 RepID=A0AAU8DMG0_9ACTN